MEVIWDEVQKFNDTESNTAPISTAQHTEVTAEGRERSSSGVSRRTKESKECASFVFFSVEMFCRLVYVGRWTKRVHGLLRFDTFTAFTLAWLGTAWCMIMIKRDTFLEMFSLHYHLSEWVSERVDCWKSMSPLRLSVWRSLSIAIISILTEGNCFRNMEPTPSKTLYINNINEKIKQDVVKKMLYMVFSQYGKVTDVIAKKGLKLRGQAWVVFEEESSAVNALRGKQGFSFYEKPLVRSAWRNSTYTLEIIRCRDVIAKSSHYPLLHEFGGIWNLFSFIDILT